MKLLLSINLKSVCIIINNRHALATVEVEIDLGFVVDSKLAFNDHISQSTAEANKTLGVIWRSFDHLTEHTFVQLYCTGHSVWQPALKTRNQDAEEVQRRATKRISNIEDKPYQERLAILRLPSPEHRRRKGDMIDRYKYITGPYDTGRPYFQLVSDSNTRGHSKKLVEKNLPRLIVRSNFFTERVVSVWNNLPEAVVNDPA